MENIGHRGACGHEPENTLRSFQRALDMGVDAIELDVYEVEKRLVVFHDDRLERTTNGFGPILQQKLGYLRALDAGKGERIPFLEEVLDLVAGRCWVNVELKGPNTALLALECAQRYSGRPGWSRDHFLFSSFDPSQLQVLERLEPGWRRGVLWNRWRPYLLQKTSHLGPIYSVHLRGDWISDSLVKGAHDRGWKVYAYTVRTLEEFLRFEKMGVDGVFSNFPELNGRARTAE